MIIGERIVCGHCNGTGVVETGYNVESTCPTCLGTGYIN